MHFCPACIIKEDVRMKTELCLSSIEIGKLLDCIQDGVFLIDNTGKIVFLNKASADLTNTPIEEMLNRSIYELIDEGILDESETVSIKALKTGKAVHRTQKGMYGKYDILSTAIPYKENGKIKYVIVTERDITYISKLMSQLDSENSRAEKYKAELEYYKKHQLKNVDIIYRSKEMQRIMAIAVQVASNDATILIQGDSGTGKEVIANIIQGHSRRKSRPFIKINCSTIPENLLESELFGYEKGAFTGASDKGKIGFFELADKGTLFLDEIDTIPLQMQPKLLRVLQESEFYRIGGDRQIKVDVRIIAATNSNLQELVREGKFRKDLFYRLNVVPILLPSLRERADDILPLTNHFLKIFNEKYSENKKISSLGQALLNQYTWPGNVRELENLIERLVVSIAGDVISEKDVQAALNSAGFFGYPEKTETGQSLKELTESFERNVIVEKMKQHHNSVELAKALGIDKTTLNRKIKRYNISAHYIR